MNRFLMQKWLFILFGLDVTSIGYIGLSWWHEADG